MHALIVEDNPVNYMIMRNQLEKLGVVAHVCLHGKEAMDYCITHGMPDLILLDGFMPEMDGIAFLSWIRNYPGGDAPYILFCSSSLDKIDVDEALRLGADTRTVPSRFSIFRRTTSMPTPRPDTFDTTSAVEKPAMKIRLSHASSLSTASPAIRPFSRALASTLARFTPAPSSRISMTIRPPWCAAENRAPAP